MSYSPHTGQRENLLARTKRKFLSLYQEPPLIFFPFPFFPPPPKKLIPLLPPLHNLEDFTIIWIG